MMFLQRRLLVLVQLSAGDADFESVCVVAVYVVDLVDTVFSDVAVDVVDLGDAFCDDVFSVDDAVVPVDVVDLDCAVGSYTAEERYAAVSVDVVG